MNVFSERIYILLGVFMIFKITVSLISWYANPDTISDGNKLYFTNDSGALFALETGEQTVDNNPTPPAQTTDTTSSTDQPVNSVKTGDDQSLVSMLTLVISGAVLAVLKKD